MLSHGERRTLELAMALATRPRALLLDEPLAGMGTEEAARMIRLLATLKGRFGVLLIEHDMDAVFALADRITVLAAGRVIASGEPESVRRDPAARAAYLGEDA
jgi:branched-chain amino acid transport system ATP-binding protein